GGLALGKDAADVGQLHAASLDAQLLLALEPLTCSCDLAGPVGIHHDQAVTGTGHACDTEHHDRNAGTGLLHGLAALVEHGADAAVVVTADERVADPERTVRNEHGRDGSLADVELCLDDGALRA